jgi:hypothetical protein
MEKIAWQEMPGLNKSQHICAGKKPCPIFYDTNTGVFYEEIGETKRPVKNFCPFCGQKLSPPSSK